MPRRGLPDGTSARHGSTRSDSPAQVSATRRCKRATNSRRVAPAGPFEAWAVVLHIARLTGSSSDRCADSDLQGSGSAAGWFDQRNSMTVNADMEARRFLAAVAIRMVPLAPLLLTILVAGCNGDGGGGGY